jgi:excisionase family DNA binding protein
MDAPSTYKDAATELSGRPETPAEARQPFKQTAFSVTQMAGRWGVSSRQVYDLCARGELGHLRIGGLIRIRLEDLVSRLSITSQ